MDPRKPPRHREKKLKPKKAEFMGAAEDTEVSKG
jgi:hypothetical protein